MAMNVRSWSISSITVMDGLCGRFSIKTLDG
jgi:hypothetical protein